MALSGVSAIQVGRCLEGEWRRRATMDCARCGGLMVIEEFCDFVDGEICVDAHRCLLCGDILDPVILSNRRSRPDPKGRSKARLPRKPRR